MTSAAIYARVSSARQKKDQTIGSQTAALRAHAGQLGAELPEEWVFEDEGHSGATLVRPALEALRDLAAQGCVDVVLCYSPDRLARKFACQALLIEEFARAGVRVEFIKGPRGDSPEDQLMVQFQGMFAEYEKAQLMERYRRGKAHRARCGSVNVLGGAPFGYRYTSKTADSGASYQIVDHEAAIAAELLRRYTDDGASIADLTRWLTSENVPTRTGKARWDRFVVWGMLRNPAYAGTAVFGKTQVLQESPGLNRRARLEGRSVPRASKTVGRPREEWIEIPVPAIVSTETFGRAAQRLASNKRYAARNTKVPSLLQGLAACSACGYAYYRTSTRTTNKKIYYYRCLGSDDYRYQGGRVCGNQPVRADYLDTVVWDHITALLAGPALIRAEISKRLEAARTSDPVTSQRKRLQAAAAKATASITAMIEAFSEQLITIDELRARMPHLRAREQNLRGQPGALDAQTADRDAYLKLADDLEGFLAPLRGNAATATVEERQRVLRLLVKDVLTGPGKITIRHRIPVRERSSPDTHQAGQPDTEGDHRPGYLLRWGRAGGNSGALVPRLVGQTSRAQAVKERTAPTARRSTRWTIDQVIESVAQAGEDSAAVAGAIRDWAAAHPYIRVIGGTGLSYPSVTMSADSGRRTRFRGVLSLYGSPQGGSPMLEIRVKRMCRTPPYNRNEARARLIADLLALGIPRLEAEDNLTDNRPNIPLSELTSGPIRHLLSIVDRWIDDVRAHATEPENAHETQEGTGG